MEFYQSYCLRNYTEDSFLEMILSIRKILREWALLLFWKKSCCCWHCFWLEEALLHILGHYIVLCVNQGLSRLAGILHSLTTELPNKVTPILLCSCEGTSLQMPSCSCHLFLILPSWLTMSEEMPLLILKLFNASYYCVEQFGNIKVKATKRKKKVWSIIDTSIVSIQV